MLKNISKVVLASFLLCGAAKAADVYKDELNTFTVNVTAKAYIGYDEAGFNDHGRGRVVAPAELVGQVELETYYFRKITDNLSGNAYVKLNIPTFGYSSGAYGYGNAALLNKNLSTFTFINKASFELNHTYLGKIEMGRFKGLYSYIIDYSDVDIFVGTPAHTHGSNFLFGSSPDTGVLYQKDIFNDAFTFAVSADAGKDSDPVVANNYITNNVGGLNFKKDFQFGVGLQTKALKELAIGAMYKYTGFRVSSSLLPSANNDLGREGAHNAIGGISYTIGSTKVGATASIQHAQFKVAPKDNTQLTAYGVEVGGSYDISGMGTGLRPSVQFDFRKTYTQNTLPSGTVKKQHNTDVLALEVGLSYYVTPNLYYQAAVVADLRKKEEIARADNIKGDMNKVTPHHYIGTGVVYKF